MGLQLRDGTGQDFLDHTQPVNFKIIAGWPAGRPVFWPARSTGFLQKVFVHCSMYLMKNFQNGGGMGEVQKFVTLDGGLRKETQNNFCVFLQK